MKLHKFKPHPAKGRRAALTSDPTGSNLPADGAPWQPLGTVEVNRGDPSRIAASSDAIIDAIESQGYYVWPITFKRREIVAAPHQ